MAGNITCRVKISTDRLRAFGEAVAKLKKIRENHNKEKAMELEKMKKAELIEALKNTQHELSKTCSERNSLEGKLDKLRELKKAYKDGMTFANNQLVAVKTVMNVIVAGDRRLPAPTSTSCGECGGYKEPKLGTLGSVGQMLQEASNSIQFQHVHEEG